MTQTASEVQVPRGREDVRGATRSPTCRPRGSGHPPVHPALLLSPALLHKQDQKAWWLSPTAPLKLLKCLRMTRVHTSTLKYRDPSWERKPQ